MKYDLEAIYKMYPRKGEGKTAGMKKLEKSIKSEEDYMNLIAAVENYNLLVKRENRDRQFIKMWSTFCNNWRDYISREDLGLAPSDEDTVYFS